MKIAVVTGASSGLGKTFALKLDKLSFDEIWGVALDKEGLEETASLMKTPLKIFAVDLTADGGRRYKSRVGRTKTRRQMACKRKRFRQIRQIRRNTRRNTAQI